MPRELVPVPESRRTPIEADYSERRLWQDSMQAYEDLMGKTSSKHTPWYVIPSNHKWFLNLAISEILDDTLVFPVSTSWTVFSD